MILMEQLRASSGSWAWRETTRPRSSSGTSRQSGSPRRWLLRRSQEVSTARTQACVGVYAGAWWMRWRNVVLPHLVKGECLVI